MDRRKGLKGRAKIIKLMLMEQGVKRFIQTPSLKTLQHLQNRELEYLKEMQSNG